MHRKRRRQFRLPDSTIVRIAERVAPLVKRGDLERALVKRGLLSFDDLRETNYGWSKVEFITSTLLEQQYSLSGVRDYLGTVSELLPRWERTAVQDLLKDGGVEIHVAPPVVLLPAHKALAGRAQRKVQGARTRSNSQLFLAHSSADKKFARKLANDLKKHGVNVWFDEWEIGVGDSVVGKIQAGLRSRSHLGVVLSQEAVKSNWVKREWGAALMKELRSRRVVVLPILYKDCEIPPLLAEKRYADFRSSYNMGLLELLAALRRRRRTGATSKAS